MKTYQTFVKLDGYETEAVRRLQKDLSKQEGRELSRQDVIRACIRYAIHDLLGNDYVLGEDLKDRLERR